MKRTYLYSCFMVIYGCTAHQEPNLRGNTVTIQEAPKTALVTQNSINGVTAESLEGKKYQVFIGSAFLGIRDQLKDGEMLTLKDVVYEPTIDGHGYFKAHYLDSKGSQIFPDYYSFSDVGLLDNRLRTIQTSISEEKVNQNRGVLLHGKTPKLAGEPSTYLYSSTSNGDKARAYPVSLSEGDESPKRLYSGLSFSCSKGKMSGVITFSEPFIALTEGATLEFSFPNRVKISVRGEAIDSESVFFSIPNKLEAKLISEDAGEVWVHPDVNSPARFPWLNNGMSEAYARVKKICNG